MAQGPMSVGAQESIKFITDKTLTQEDIAADAKVVGEKLAKKFDAAGGTLAGNLSFPPIGDTDVSKKLIWSGSTDGAEIYYQTIGPDHGRLVINLKDDDNCELVIAQNGAARSYFSPADGKFHGDMQGTASYATNAGNAESVDQFHFAQQKGDSSCNKVLVYYDVVPVVDSSGAVLRHEPKIGYRTTQSLFKESLADYKVDLKGAGCARFQNGLQLCWGKGTSEGFVPFILPFIDTTYQVSVTPVKSVMYDFYVSGKSTAGFTMAHQGKTPTSETIYTAMGWWRYTKEIEE